MVNPSTWYLPGSPCCYAEDADHVDKDPYCEQPEVGHDDHDDDGGDDRDEGCLETISGEDHGNSPAQFNELPTLFSKFW